MYGQRACRVQGIAYSVLGDLWDAPQGRVSVCAQRSLEASERLSHIGTREIDLQSTVPNLPRKYYENIARTCPCYNINDSPVVNRRVSSCASSAHVPRRWHNSRQASSSAGPARCSSPSRRSLDSCRSLSSSPSRHLNDLDARLHPHLPPGRMGAAWNETDCPLRGAAVPDDTASLFAVFAASGELASMWSKRLRSVAKTHCSVEPRSASCRRQANQSQADFNVSAGQVHVHSTATSAEVEARLPH